MLGGYLDRAFGPGGQSTDERTEWPASDGLWTQFTDWLGEQIDAMNESPSSSGSGADNGESTNGWSEPAHYTSCGDGGSGGGDGASSC